MENLSKEKAELSEKLHAQEEGTVLSLTLMFLCYNYVGVQAVSVFFSTEYVAQKDEITNAIKANYEKILNTERTLKTQVKIQLFWSEGICKH